MPRATSTLLLAGSALACSLGAVAMAASGLDLRAFLAANAWAARRLPDGLPGALTLLGNGFAAMVLVSPWIRRDPRVPVAALLGAPFASVFSRLGKLLAAEPRPAAVLDPSTFTIHGPLLAGHNAFPSGHSITIFLVVSAAILCSRDIRARPAWALPALLLGAAVCASRIFVGAHWPSDVLAGAALGTLAGAGGAWLSGRWPLHASPVAVPVLSLAVLAGSIVFLGAETGDPQALPVQQGIAALGCAIGALHLVAWWRGRGAAA